MYRPAHFRCEDPALTARLVDSAPFATLVTQLDGSPFATHLPLLRGDQPDLLIGHIARANPHWQSFGKGEALAIFHGPHAYVSPTAYASTPNVPTWNYAAVHAVGEIAILEGDRAREVLARLTARFESRRPSPWTMESVGEELIQKLLKAIVAFEFRVSRWETKLKLSQNKSDADLQSMIADLERSGDPSAYALATLTREHGRRQT